MALVQIGTMALRSPNGEFLPSVAIYREAAEEDPESEYIPIDELAEIFANKFQAFKAAESRQKKKRGT